MSISQWKNILKYDASNSRWYYDSSTNQSGSNFGAEGKATIPNSTDYPYSGFTTPYEATVIPSNYDYYAVATYGTALTNAQVRDLVFDPTKASAVVSGLKQTGATIEVNLTKVVSDNIIAPLSVVNQANVYVYAKKSGTVSGSGF